MWIFEWKGPSGFSARSTAQGVTEGIDGNGLTAIVTAVAGSVAKFVLKNVQQGTATQCYVALNPQVKGVSGEYFVDSNIANSTNHVKDMELAKKLWNFSVELTSKK